MSAPFRLFFSAILKTADQPGSTGRREPLVLARLAATTGAADMMPVSLVSESPDELVLRRGLGDDALVLEKDRRRWLHQSERLARAQGGTWIVDEESSIVLTEHRGERMVPRSVAPQPALGRHQPTAPCVRARETVRATQAPAIPRKLSDESMP